MYPNKSDDAIYKSRFLFFQPIDSGEIKTFVNSICNSKKTWNYSNIYNFDENITYRYIHM